MGRIPRRNDILVVFKSRQLGEVLGEGLPGDRQATAVDRPVLEQELEHRRRTANCVQIFHDVAATRFQIGQIWECDRSQPGSRQSFKLTPTGTCHRDEVKHRVGRSTR